MSLVSEIKMLMVPSPSNFTGDEVTKLAAQLIQLEGVAFYVEPLPYGFFTLWVKPENILVLEQQTVKMKLS